MARGIRGARSYRRTAPTPPSDQDVGDALRTVFGSREKVAEFFGALEAKLVAEMQRICAEGKRARDAEFSIPPEDDLPTVDCPLAPLGGQISTRVDGELQTRNVE